MGKASPIKTSFNGGIQSPLLQGHIDAPSRQNSVKDSTNLLPLKQGPIVRRGGTEHINRQRNTIPPATIDYGSRSHLIPFYYNDTDKYMLEITPDFEYGTIMRTYQNGAIVNLSTSDRTITNVEVFSGETRITVDGGTALGGPYSVPGAVVTFSGLTKATELNTSEYKIKAQVSTYVYSITDYDGSDIGSLSTEGASSGTCHRPLNTILPYNYDDLFDSDGLFRVNYEQSNDVLYLAHPDYPLQALTRTSSSPLTWSVDDLLFINGPWDENDTDIEIGLTTANTWPNGRDFTLGTYATGNSPNREYVFNRDDCSFNNHLTTIESVTASDSVTTTPTKVVINHTDITADLTMIRPVAVGDEIVLGGLASSDYAASPWSVLSNRSFKIGAIGTTTNSTTEVELTDPVTGDNNYDTDGFTNGHYTPKSAKIQTNKVDRQVQIYFERNREWPEIKTRWRWGRITSIPSTSPTSIIDSKTFYADVIWEVDEGKKKPFFGSDNSWLKVRYDGKSVEQTGPGGGGSFGGTATDRTNATLWSTGTYCKRNGYPSFVSLHEGRLVIGGTTANPRRVDLSASNEFSPTQAKFFPFNSGGTIKDNAAIQANIGGGDGSPIVWVESTAKGLLVGTTQRVGLLSSDDNASPITPTNASYKLQNAVGCADIKPIPIGDSVLFVQAARRKLHEMGYNFQTDGYSAPDLSTLAEHLTRTGIVDMAWQQEPINVLWLVLTDGSLIALTYDKSSEVVGWHRHTLGGQNVTVDSVAVLPSDDNSRDELWLAVTRDISSGTYTAEGGNLSDAYKFVERMDRWYEDDIDQEDAFHLDGGTKYTSALVSNIDYSVTSGELTILTGSLSVGDVILFENTDTAPFDVLSGTYMKIGSSSELVYLDGSAFDGGSDAGITTYEGTGGFRVCTNTFTGLQHLAGNTVSVYADGRWLTNQTVPGGIQGDGIGTVTLDTNQYGARVSIGLPTTWHMETHRIEAGNEYGTAQGKLKRIDEVGIRVYNTLGLQVGDSATNLRDVVEAYGANAGVKTPLYTGDHIIKPWPGTYEREGYMYFKGEGPFPAQIQAIMPRLKTND